MSDEQVERGMMLLVREGQTDVLPERHRLWTVTSVRRGAKSSAVKLLRYEDGVIVEATATFPDHLVQEPWQVFALSQNDLGHVWRTVSECSE